MNVGNRRPCSPVVAVLCERGARRPTVTALIAPLFTSRAQSRGRYEAQPTPLSFWIHEESKTVYIVDLFWKKTNTISTADRLRSEQRIRKLRGLHEVRRWMDAHAPSA